MAVNLKYEYIITFVLLIMNLFQILANNNLLSINSKFSNITLKIKGTGNRYIFGHDSYYYFDTSFYPHLIYINGDLQKTIKHNYNFNKTENYVKLVWNFTINNCGNMFYECSDITEIDLSNFDTSQVEIMYYMFYGCSSLTSINLFNFKTSNVTVMHYMFYNCYSIQSLNLSSFDTTQVTRMDFMFSHCSSLISLNLTNFITLNAKDMNNMFSDCKSFLKLDLSNFDTSQVSMMNSMFSNCLSLISLILSNFNTSQVTWMHYMFSNCSSLISLNLSNFNTSQVKFMNFMFYGCSSLTSLNLSNFNTSQLTKIQNMFYGCINLEYIHLQNFDDSKLLNGYYDDIFEKVPNNIVVCINVNNDENKIYSQIKDKICHSNDCSNNWKLSQKKIINGTETCIDSCDISPIYKYEFNGRCYEKEIIDYNNYTNESKCELIKCLTLLTRIINL